MFDKKTSLALIIFFIGFIINHFVLMFKIYPLGLLLFYVVIYGILHILLKMNVVDNNTNKINHWPTSGPIGKYGQKGLVLMLYGTGILSFLNPFQLVQIIRQAMGNFILKNDKSNIIDDATLFKSDIIYRLPF